MADLSTKPLIKNLDKAQESAQNVVDTFDVLIDRIKETGEVVKKAFSNLDLKDSKDIATLNKLLGESTTLVKQQTAATTLQNKAAKEVLLIEQQKIKLVREETLLAQQKVKATKEEELLAQQRIKTDILLAKEKERLSKIEEKNQKQIAESNRAYAKQSKRLTRLRNEYKDLVISEGKTTKATRKLLREVKKLDKELKDVDASAGQFQRNVGEYPDTFGKALESIKGLAGGAIGLGAAFEGVKGALEASEEGSEDLRKVTAATGAVVDTTKNRIATFALGLFQSVKALAAFHFEQDNSIETLETFATGVDKLNKSTEGYTEEINANVDAATNAEEQTIALEKSTRNYNVTLAKLTGEFEKQNAIAGDSTRGFDEIEEAAQKAAKISLQRAAILQKIAKEELNIINQLIEARPKDANNLELLNKKSEAQIKLIEAGNSVRLEQLDLEKVIRENQRDRFERELDFAIDAFDTIKTINERVIANEKNSLDVRRALFKETEELTNKSFEQQIKLVEEFTGEKLNLDELALESDEEVIRQRLRNADLDDVTFGRVLEIIRERKIAQQDLIEANQDLVESETELSELQRDIADQEVALASTNVEKFEQLEDERLTNEIENVNARLEVVKAGSIEEARLHKELNDLLLEQQQIAADEQLERDEDKAEKALEATAENEAKRKELIEKSIDAIDAIIQKSFDKRNEAIDKELVQSKDAQDRIRAGIEAGNEDALQSLAVEERRTEELEAKKEANRKKAQRAEAAIALLKNLGENGGDLGKTLGNYNAILAAIQAAPSFFDGTDETSSDVIMSDQYGGVTGFVHAKEQVWSQKDRSDVGFKTRDQIKDIVNSENRNLLTDSNIGLNVINGDNGELIIAVNKMQRTLESLPKNMPTSNYDYDAKGKYHIQTIKSQGKIERIRTKANTTWA